MNIVSQGERRSRREQNRRRLRRAPRRGEARGRRGAGAAARAEGRGCAAHREPGLRRGGGRDGARDARREAATPRHPRRGVRGLRGMWRTGCRRHGGCRPRAPADVFPRSTTTGWNRSETRRGGPSVHVLLAETFGDAHTSAAAAILAGDQASAFAQEALLDLPLPPECVVAAVRELSRIQQDVIAGQLLDVHGGAVDGDAMERCTTSRPGATPCAGLSSSARCSPARAPTSTPCSCASPARSASRSSCVTISSVRSETLRSRASRAG